MYYIQRKDDGYLETVDECDRKSEAKRLLSEYRMSDTKASYYISTRCCREWKTQ